MAAVGNPQYNPWSGATPQPEVAIDEVRTIFVLGFPPDVKERELQNLLRWWPGYEASQMNFKGDQPMGFALFSTASMAMAARDALQNLVFDADAKSVLRAEMAKKNLYVKRGVTGINAEGTAYDHSKRMRTGGECTPAYPPPFAPPPPPAWPPQGYMAPAPYDPYGSYPVAQVPPPVPPPAPVAPAGYAPVQNTKDNPPCNTLFIGNLGEATSEAELRGLFSSQPGFRQMKVLRQGRSTVCFIEFVDVNTAMAVHTNLQGAVLSTSDRGGMRIQYSKNPYGRKKEGPSGQLDGIPPPGVSSPTLTTLSTMTNGATDRNSVTSETSTA
ncbi:cell wall integrity protein scw1 isoform X2 [Selaginella moellendorffii]|uniref:cell wall integrity protein scw1 isoform X2 n=1 Tax=Selaginella moellendorffii TaxID=88036 RepID=UPI000D1C60E3|nr:cell wall integrity protein scw1 isoform X2 [Selaginella moellendorffii]XP_024537162.1 cell wall integrity protein scw1 isoform X2 [Selaginella moellendorffii]|eukprot:XP_024516969.1 cell wall integrity protein scw1 isoform X2 [Selaginella moellendorffii]